MEKKVWISPMMEMIEMGMNDVIATSGEEPSSVFILNDITDGGDF